MTDNYYAAPEAELIETTVLESENMVLASRWARLGAVWIDGIISSLIIFPIMFAVGFFEKAMQGIKPGFVESLLWGVAGWVVFFIVHGFFLKSSGQTIGKKALGIKIVNEEGEVPEFLPLLFQRYVILWALGLIPMIGGLVGFGDMICIFRKDKRCIHDMIAKTKVVKI